MRRTAALIVGGGPAGAAAAIRLARGGVRPLLVERSAGPRDMVCGGFLGWDALANLRKLDIDPGALGARPIDRVRFVSPEGSVETALPHPAAGLSRRTLDEALLDRARAAGAEILRGRAVRAASSRRVRLDDDEEIEAEALLLATGKHELRGHERDASIAGAAIGLRCAIGLSDAAARAIDGTIELHLFDGGYAGLLIQDDGRCNFCLSASRARLKAAGGPQALLERLTGESSVLAERLAGGDAGDWSAVAGVPYGWRARRTVPGVYRIGDQAAVIASLAGDGIAVALASGLGGAEALLEETAAADWQRSFHRRSRRPIMVAEMLRRAAEAPRRRAPLMQLLSQFPSLARIGARLTRIGS
ncbi:NAD(P)/FAD-dependent oxidoreductase [Sphingosinicella sp. BN140058]|uniref:NAD(P)/FAD-dependent oxidoreductase n=1 Tax=Sphingosinicella sp. BN140058 TaxID=1892855 RepID=UPI0010106A90|nr:FAD-dependent monooxygenase [Sphingosinicella sp. BN140058]QAY77062.1 oxidoreductase [Sphingosinicella sp. BN140058]